MRLRPAVAIATVSAIFVYFAAAGVETLLIERLRPTEVELTWISDGILALAFGVAMVLWLNLKWTRLTLCRERGYPPPATHLQGTVAVGTPVDVRYREDGKTYVAAAITAQQPKPQANRSGNISLAAYSDATDFSP